MQSETQVGSNSGSSSRKRRRGSTPKNNPEKRQHYKSAAAEEDPEARFNEKKAERLEQMRMLRICCILDPSRVFECYEDIGVHSCWVEAKLPGGKEEVDALVGSEALTGYVFRVPDEVDTVTIYDWVSNLLLFLFNVSYNETQAYVAYSCFRQAGYAVEFERWQTFSTLLKAQTPDSVAKKLRDGGFDCLFGGIDLSIR